MLWTTPIARRLLIAAAVASTAPRSAISTDVGACLAWRGECIAFANERAPALDTPLGCLNMAATTQCTLSDFLQRGKYVVLWFYPDDPTGIQDANNLKEALSFEKLKPDFEELDSIPVGISAQSQAKQKALVDERLLTLPLPSDPQQRLISSYSAYRSTFVIDPSGTVRWAERNIDFGVGNFNLDNHAQRVQRAVFKIRNEDGWSV